MCVLPLYISNVKIFFHLFGKKNAHEMWMALQKIFQNKNKNQILVLEDKLNSTKMIKGEGVTLYLTNFSRVRYELATISVVSHH